MCIYGKYHCEERSAVTIVTIRIWKIVNVALATRDPGLEFDVVLVNGQFSGTLYDHMT